MIHFKGFGPGHEVRTRYVARVSDWVRRHYACFRRDVDYWMDLPPRAEVRIVRDDSNTEWVRLMTRKAGDDHGR